MILVIIALFKYVFKKPSEDRVEQSTEHTKNLFSRNFDKFKANISTRQPQETRLIIYDQRKYRAIATATITYPTHQFNKPVLERDFPKISWEFKDFQKHSKYAHEVGELCLKHVCKEGYGGGTFNLQTDYTNLMDRMGIKDSDLSVNHENSNPFRYDIPLYNSLDNQAPKLGEQITKLTQRHPQAIQDLEKFVDRKIGRKSIAQNSKFKNKEIKIERKRVSPIYAADARRIRIFRLKQAIACECANDRLFADMLLSELKQSQNQYQKHLIKKARRVMKCPTRRAEMEYYIYENKGNEELGRKIKRDRQEEKLKQELKQKGKLHELKQPESTIKF